MYLVHLQNHNVLSEEALHELKALSLRVLLVSMVVQVLPFPQAIQFLYGKSSQGDTNYHSSMYFEWFQFFTSVTRIQCQTKQH